MAVNKFVPNRDRVTMSVIGMNLSGAGIWVPLSDYQAGISKSFPCPPRLNTVESSIASRQTFDALHINQTVNNSIRGSYLEFRVPGIEGQFLDVLTLAVDISVTKADGVTPLDADDHSSLVNSLSNATSKAYQFF